VVLPISGLLVMISLLSLVLFLFGLLLFLRRKNPFVLQGLQVISMAGLCFIVSCGGSNDSRFGKDLLGQSACNLSATEVETTMTYDTYGNLISVTNGRKIGGGFALSVGGKQFRESIGEGGPTPPIITPIAEEVTMVVTDYLGNEGYFPHTVTSGVGATSKRCVSGQACTQSIAMFDLGLGVLLTSTDSNGAVSRSEYDGLGRLLRSYLPGDTDPSVEVTDYALTANPPYVRTITKVNDTQELITRSYADGLGRSIGSVSGAGSDFIFSGYTRANNAGQVLVSYQPIARTNESFLSSLPPSSGCSTTSFSGAYCSEFSYEDGHVSKVKHPGGETTQSYVGEDYGISTDENGIQTFAQVDALGRTLNVQTDFGNPGSQTHTITTHVYDGLSKGFPWTQKTTAPRNLVTESFVDAQGRVRGINAPAGGEAKYNGFKTWYDFDQDGNLIYVFSGSDVIQTQYDALNRPTIVSVSRNEERFQMESENIYDEQDERRSSFNQGRLTTAKSFGEHRLEVEFGYDIQGHLEFQKYSDPNLSLFNPTLALKLLKFDYDYNRSGALTKITDPRGYSVAYNYDVFGRLKAQSPNPQTANEAALSYNGKSIVGDVIYDQAGRIEEIHYGHGVKDVFEFDPLGRVKEINGSSPIAGSSYTYTPNGNLDTAMESDGTSQNFLYDNLNRLTLASSQSQDPELSYQISYGYDPSGNLTSLSGMDPTGSVDQAPLRTYATDSNRLLSTLASRATNVFYDQHGSITNYVIGNTSRLIEYDGLGRLAELQGPNGTVKVTYGPSGKIARKRPNGSHEIYLEGAGGLLTFDQEKNLWKTHISALGRVIATMDHEDTIEFHHADRLSSTAAVTYVHDSFQIQTKSKTLYLPFGEERKRMGGPSTLEKFAFTNQERDQDMQLYDYGARYYDSVLRRFLQPDSILDTTGTSQGQNRYAYVLGNPLRYNDPTGHMPEDPDRLVLASTPGTAWAEMALGDSIWPMLSSQGKEAFLNRMRSIAENNNIMVLVLPFEKVQSLYSLYGERGVGGYADFTSDGQPLAVVSSGEDMGATYAHEVGHHAAQGGMPSDFPDNDAENALYDSAHGERPWEISASRWADQQFLSFVEENPQYVTGNSYGMTYVAGLRGSFEMRMLGKLQPQKLIPRNATPRVSESGDIFKAGASYGITSDGDPRWEQLWDSVYTRNNQRRDSLKQWASRPLDSTGRPID